MLYFPRSLIGDEASVTATISDMNALALKMFFNSLNCHASKLLEKVGCTDENWIQAMIYLIWKDTIKVMQQFKNFGNVEREKIQALIGFEPITFVKTSANALILLAINIGNWSYLEFFYLLKIMIIYDSVYVK